MVNREAIKKLQDMIVDSQYAQQLGMKVFNGQASTEEMNDLRKAGEDILEEVKTWLELVPVQH
jgi:hypothetical protein